MCKFHLTLLFTIILNIGTLFKVSSQLMINEFMASNSSLVIDPDFNDNPDWIEIYNAGDTAVNLLGYYITDNISNFNKWQILEDTILLPHRFIVIWADDADTLLHTSFKLSQEGEEIGIFSPYFVKVDSLVYNQQKTNISYGRNPDNINEWGFFENPTPGDINGNKIYSNFVSSIPYFNINGGIFNTFLNIEIKNIMGGIVRYTLDGTEPNDVSDIYTSVITVDTNTVIRARIFKNNEIPGPVVTNTYFIDDNINNSTLPVFSIAADPANFWDSEFGIYVQDFKPEWEIPVNIEFFENNGSDRAAFNSNAGVKVNGLYSWQLPQKMLGVYFRKRYGDGNLEYPLIFNSNRKKYGNFALRASGNDWSNTLFKDAMLQLSTMINMDIEIQNYRPSILYVNGQYMGIHNIREKVDNDYIENIYGLDPGTYDLIENEDFAEVGDLNAYNNFKALLGKDLSVDENYIAVTDLMDIENFTDLAIVELYSNNTSLSHNVMAWKPKNSGKWRWILMDLDRGMENPQSNLINYFMNVDEIPLEPLFDNDNYVEYFGKRLADQLYTTFNPQQIINNIEKNRLLILNEIPRHIKRWEGTTSSYGDAIPSLSYWEDEINKLKQYAMERPGVLLNNLRNYGFDETQNLQLAVYPENAGQIEINGLKIPKMPWNGEYLLNTNVILEAVKKSGYDFIGWSVPAKKNVVPKESVWKYLDDGSDQGTQWQNFSFDDSGWSSGKGQLGYGDGDENTIVGYGGNSSDKNITTYFRHKFTLTQDEKNNADYIISLLCDDGAVVYLNENEIIRYNMPTGVINYNTVASSTIENASESEFISYDFNNNLLQIGENILTVEIHQRNVTSSDISFDFELSGIIPDISNIISTDPSYNFTFTEETFLTAVHEQNDVCFLPQNITEDFTITKNCSPILVVDDVIIGKDAALIIEPGVEVRMSPGSDIYVNGSIISKGTKNDIILFTIDPEFDTCKWGSIIFNNTIDTSYLSYTTIERAYEGPVSVTQGAAISAFKANLVMDHIIVEDIYSNPIAARYSDITLLNSSLHSEVTGDLINVKYGKARIENCIFRGNKMVDTDAIDYDDVENGIVTNCKIYDLLGVNNDAIDIGEKSKNILIDSILVYNVVDKGVSFGQQSSGSVTHSTFVNCNMGLGLKDSCLVRIDHCDFYNVNTPIACYEKNLGSAGGNGQVTNTILSNSSDHSFSADSKSTLEIAYSISDNDTLPNVGNNLYGNPEFVNPTFFNFNLNKQSLCVGNANGSLMNIGSYFHGYNGDPGIMISKIFYNAENTEDVAEFISITNPDNKPVDLSGFHFAKGIDYTFPKGITIQPGEEIYIAEYLNFPKRYNINGRLYNWTTGKLANEGDKIVLVDPDGIVVDYVKYDTTEAWYVDAMRKGEVLILKSMYVDNHFPESWISITMDELLQIDKVNDITFNIYPNPSKGKVYVNVNSDHCQFVDVYSLSGRLLKRKETGNNRIVLDLTEYKNQLLIIKAGIHTFKILITE